VFICKKIAKYYLINCFVASLFDGETYYSKKKRKFHFFYGTLERPLPLIPSQEGKLNPPNSKENFTVFIENQLLRGFPS
jgi:hypothetical protein